jgi:gamma-butyrobetaine dioxygenase
VRTLTTIDELFALYEMKGHQNYGEVVSALDHALQCAALARADGADDALIVAALFHDVGWLVADVAGDERFVPNDDDDHAELGARVLWPLLGTAVAQPVAQHVTAKRWRCTIEPDHYQGLSRVSQATFKTQGGPLSPEEVERFASHPGFEAARALRSWDDAGKTQGLDAGTLRDYEELVRRLAAEHGSVSGQALSFPAIWLRDNCPCALCRDPRSQRKFFQITDLPEGLSVADVEVTDDKAVVTFLPDGHRSVFSREWLASQASSRVGDGRNEQDKWIWSAGDFAATSRHADWSSYCSDDAVRLDVLRGIERFGFAVLHGTPTEERTVLTVARTFGFVRETNYGELFDVRVEVNASNLAFTGVAISPHTDNPYRDPVPTMQLLHCLSNDVDGGESGLVDGFRVAAMLRDEQPHFFDVLTSTPVMFAWGDAYSALCAERPMIELDPLGRIRGIRFNNRSMQALQLDGGRIIEYYDAYRYFARIAERPELMLTFRLEAGDCLVFDNTRLLHARTAFQDSCRGRRHLQGCYSDLDGLASTVAVLERAHAAQYADT